MSEWFPADLQLYLHPSGMVSRTNTETFQKCGWETCKGFCRSSDSTNLNSSEISNNTTEYELGAFLPLNAGMAVPIYISPSREEVEAVGQMLLHFFLQEQFAEEELSEEDQDEVENLLEELGEAELEDEEEPPNLAARFSDSTPDYFADASAHLRELANKFAASRERALIREQAQQVDLSQISREEFSNLLNEIFRNGTDTHNIIALFFFCSDVLVRCVRKKLRPTGNKLLLWSMLFLARNVCLWVFNKGGWERVLSNLTDLRNYAILAIGVFIASCSFIWVIKNW